MRARLTAMVARLGHTSVTIEYRFLRDDELLLEATVRHVFTERSCPYAGWP